MDDPSRSYDVDKSGKRKRNEDYKFRPWYTNMNGWTGDKFKKEFRISRNTFDLVYQSIEGHWPNKERLEYPVDERLAIALWRLANGASNIQCITKFGISDRAFIKNTNEIYDVIEIFLKEKYLRWPETEDLARIKHEFEKLSSIPHIIGSLYTTHFLIKHTKDVPTNPQLKERFGRNLCSIPVQGVVDSQGKFVHVFCSDDVLGDKTDMDVLLESKIYEKVGPGDYIVGDDAYPLQEKLLVPYEAISTLTPRQNMLNIKIGDVQEIVKKAFGELVGRWSLLGKQIEVPLSKIPRIVYASCILHNICKEKEDKLNVEFTAVVNDSLTPVFFGDTSSSAVTARDKIASGLSMSEQESSV